MSCKSYLIPRSNKEYQCHWCHVVLPTHSPYVQCYRGGGNIKMHVGCVKQLVQRGWLYELDLQKLGFGYTQLDSSSEDSAWQEYIGGALTR